MVTRRGVRVPFPECLKDGKKRALALTPAPITANFLAHLRAANMKDKRCTIPPFRVGGTASNNMDGTAMHVLTEVVGWKSVTEARRYVTATTSATAAGVKCTREMALKERMHCRCPSSLRVHTQRCYKTINSGPTRDKRSSLAIIRVSLRSNRVEKTRKTCKQATALREGKGGEGIGL